jgi:predicted Zn-dependent protease with MMP-like domain
MTRLTFSEFCDVVAEAVESLPEAFQPYLENVVVDVFNEATAEDLKQVEGRDDLHGEVLGLFIGVPITEQSYGQRPMNVVKIFRRPLERVSRSREALLQNIRATILHEFGHHFGYSEDDLDGFERTQDRWLS